MTNAGQPEKNQKKSSGRGGRRPGAGRKIGSVSARSRKFAEQAIESGELLPLDFMLAALRDEEKPFDVRMDAAKAAAPYIHAKLASVDASMKGDMSLTITINKP